MRSFSWALKQSFSPNCLRFGCNSSPLYNFLRSPPSSISSFVYTLFHLFLSTTLKQKSRPLRPAMSPLSSSNNNIVLKNLLYFCVFCRCAVFICWLSWESSGKKRSDTFTSLYYSADLFGLVVRYSRDRRREERSGEEQQQIKRVM